MKPKAKPRAPAAKKPLGRPPGIHKAEVKVEPTPAAAPAVPGVVKQEEGEGVATVATVPVAAAAPPPPKPAPRGLKAQLKQKAKEQVAGAVPEAMHAHAFSVMHASVCRQQPCSASTVLKCAES